MKQISHDVMSPRIHEAASCKVRLPFLAKAGLSSRDACARSCRCVSSSAAIVSQIIRRRRSIAPSKGRPLPPALCRRIHRVMRLAPFVLLFFFYFIFFASFFPVDSLSGSDSLILICHMAYRYNSNQ